MLSSDILEKQFGQTKITILSQDDNHRLIETITVGSNEVLELSLVTFDSENTQVFPEIHEIVKAGESMGKAYRHEGVKFTRIVNFATKYPLPDKIKSRFSSKGVATVVDVDILVGTDQVHYCHIVEIYNPKVKWPKTNKPSSPTIDENVNNILRYL